MILSFSGDRFLAERAMAKALEDRGVAWDQVVVLGEDVTGDDIRGHAVEQGLFGQPALLIDFDKALAGKPPARAKELLSALEGVPDKTIALVVDSAATPSRQKALGALGRHTHEAAPRRGALVAWVRKELQAASVAFERDVPQVMAELFGEDLPAIASEVAKLAVLGESVSKQAVLRIANRTAPQDAFDLIEAVTAGRAAEALDVCRQLTELGEPPAKVLSVFVWQFNLVADCVAVNQSRPNLQADAVAKVLRVKPFAASKALKVARRFDEASLHSALNVLCRAEEAMKTGRDEAFALESMTIQLARLVAKAP